MTELFKPENHKGFNTPLNSHKAKLLQATAPLLIDRLLNEGEKVHRIASGIAYFPFEIPYANGLVTWPLNSYALIATNQRLILINLDRHLTRPDRYVFQIPLGEIAGISRGFYGSSLIIRTNSGRVWDFTTVKRPLAKTISEFVQQQISQKGPTEALTHQYPQLCPACFQPVADRAPSCPNCHTSFKSANEAMKKSLLLPGLGPIYLGYFALGIVEMLGYLTTWLLTIILVIIGIPGGILGGGMLVLAYHLMAAFMAGKMAQKGLLPEQYFEVKSPPVMLHKST